MMSDKEAEDTKAFANAKNDIVKIKGNKAIVTSSNDKRGIDLVKQDGKWLVDINIDEE